MPKNSAANRSMSFLNGACVLAAAIGFSVLFWPRLWTGGGLIGGDTYTYYFPQKTELADALRDGRLPFWNSNVSLGYPQLAESQTGALYPLYVVLYRLLDVNTAYNAGHLLHYIAAYIFTWLLARRLGLGSLGSHLAALSFVYGWFPVRACLEWAIVGGAYFPLILWCLESYLQTPRMRWLVIATIALAAFLVTGHFNLAFITLLASAFLIFSRLTWAREQLASQVANAPMATVGRWLASVGLGFALAAPQLIPSAELKTTSQREDGGGFNQSYGHIPIPYLTQPLWPSLWYAPEINPDQNLPNSNQIEAHLYFGVIPLYLAALGLLGALFGRNDESRGAERRRLVFSLLGVLGVVLATGLLMPALRWIPGFGYFAGPGRYGMLAALAIALAGGRMLDRLASHSAMRGLWPVLFLLAMGITAKDLAWVADRMTYLTFVERPPISLRSESTVARRLGGQERPVRLFAPGPNLPTMMGVNCVPEYLGIGPKQYYDKSLAIPRYDQDRETPELRESLVRWLQNAGVTHVLRQSPLDESAWPVGPRQELFDPFLNASWGRGREPLYLYELQGARARVFLEGEPDGGGVALKALRPERITAEVEAAAAGRLVLLELPYPGWQVTVDGQPAEGEVFEKMFRAVRVPAGRHVVEWRFQPRSFTLGLVVFAAALLTLFGWALWERRRLPQQA